MRRMYVFLLVIIFWVYFFGGTLPLVPYFDYAQHIASRGTIFIFLSLFITVEQKVQDYHDKRQDAP